MKIKMKMEEKLKNLITWSSDTNKFGYRMLEKMGWKSGSGLGKDLQGKENPIRLIKKSQDLGIGCLLKQQEEIEWSNTSSGFSQLLTKLNETYKNTSLESNNKLVQEKELKRKQKKTKKEKKEKKKEKYIKVKHSAKNKNIKDDKSLKELKARVNRRILYKKRISCKTVGNYDKDDLKGILGGP